MSEAKTCTKCGQAKSVDQFNRDKSKSDGRRPDCKDCQNKRGKNYYQANRESELKRARGWYRNNRGRVSEQKRRYYQANRKRINAQSRRHYLENRKVILTKHRQWREANPGYYSEWGHYHYLANPGYYSQKARRRRAMRHNAPGSHTAEEFAALCDKYGSRCLRCGEKRELTVDHVIPLSQGGGDDIANIQPLCDPCNKAKATKSTDYRPS